jgi:hypothetical protein
MSIVVRSANLQTDEQLIIDFLAQNHTADSNQQRFNWLYRSNPAGEARAWIAFDSETSANIGVAAAFPRLMCIGNGKELAWVLGDFCIVRGHRSMGPALQLQRACLAGLDAERGAIYYDFPSETMTAIYRRLGISQTSCMVRLARPLRVDKKLRSVVRQPQLARVLASVANMSLTLRDRGFRLPPGLMISGQQSACGNEFTQLAQKLGSATGTCVQRSAGYLNWRYRQHPFLGYEIFTLHRNRSLVGYAIANLEGQHLNVVDLFGEQETISLLMRSVVSIAQERKLETVTTSIVALHPWAKILRTLGFRQREKYPVVISNGREDSMEKSDGWLLMHGDRES